MGLGSFGMRGVRLGRLGSGCRAARGLATMGVGAAIPLLIAYGIPGFGVDGL